MVVRNGNGPFDLFLKRYLIFTGTLSAILLIAPGLLIFGLMLMVLPGVFLAVMPTAFLWGAMFAAFYWAGGFLLSPLRAAMLAIAVTAGLVWAIPQPSISAGRRLAANHQLTNVKPVGPIKPFGDIRMESSIPDYGRDPFSCDSRCVALLFEDSVHSVTVNSSRGLSFDNIQRGAAPLSHLAQTYRLKPLSECPASPTVDRNLKSPFGETEQDRWKLGRLHEEYLANDVCLIAEPPLTDYDLLLREGLWGRGWGAGKHSWLLSRNRIILAYVEIRDRSHRPLFRAADTAVEMPIPVLTILPNMEHVFDYQWEWGRHWMPRELIGCLDCSLEKIDAMLQVRRKRDDGRAVFFQPTRLRDRRKVVLQPESLSS
ncbi:hypothetical protein KRZ98_15185 [Sphingobium sp. AS12]|uniref:hypothetical protein n=1 Tax=Sphingobium sp. AS12 TaxID=2849495 RepID=UPI001C31607D|nr:hypothetical protein [Sphingobium sp. AS12]MBV2149615.1 hypothetical protein [Sphingobium sp. AS12]